jgi:hypothetical protein
MLIVSQQSQKWRRSDTLRLYGTILAYSECVLNKTFTQVKYDDDDDETSVQLLIIYSQT